MQFMFYIQHMATVVPEISNIKVNRSGKPNRLHLQFELKNILITSQPKVLFSIQCHLLFPLHLVFHKPLYYLPLDMSYIFLNEYEVP